VNGSQKAPDFPSGAYQVLKAAGLLNRWRPKSYRIHSTTPASRALVS